MIDKPTAIDIRRDAEVAAATFPALLVEAERIAQTVAAGLHGRRRAGPGETFWQHRPYSFGDPVSAIDWRQSARISDRLFVRENEWEAAAAIYLWRDPSASLDFASLRSVPHKSQRANVLAVALSILLSQAGERVGLLGEDRRPFHGRGAPSRILEALLTDAKGGAAPPPAHPRPGARIVMFSDFYSDMDAVDASVRALAGGGASGALVQICDPAEEDFPYSGRVEFRDLESRERLTFGDTGALAKSYKSQFAAHRGALQSLAQNAGWTFIAHRTDRPAQHVLLALFTALADMRRWSA